MSVPTAAGTRRVAGVSRRRPRSGPVRVRVGGWLDVITPPSSHMCGGREAPPRASRRWRGGGRGGTAAAGRPWGAPTGGRRGGAERVCVCARLPKMRRGVPSPYSCGARRTGMPRAPNSAATSGLRADRRIRFGVLCRIRASMAGAPGHGVGHGTSVPTSPATRTFPATGFRPLAGAEARPPRARLSASVRSPSSSQPRPKPRPPLRTAHPPPVKPGPPLRTARPRPVKPGPPLRTAHPPPVKPRPPLSPGTPAPSETTTTPVARQGPFLRHFGQAGAVGVSQNPQAGDAGAVGVSSSGPATPRDGGDVTDCRLSREAPAR